MDKGALRPRRDLGPLGRRAVPLFGPRAGRPSATVAQERPLRRTLRNWLDNAEIMG
jgi:hypothetical protein